MFTYSGIFVSIENDNAPTLVDIAVQTGRITRFAGATNRWWTVLHHHLAAGLLVQYQLEETDPQFYETQLAAYLHDAHEAITSDIPRDWKPPEVNDYQRKLDVRIYKSLNMPPPTHEVHLTVKAVDNALLVAEASQIAADGITRHPEIVELKKQLWPIIPLAMSAVYEVRQRYKNPSNTLSENAKAVQDYITYVSYLIHKLDQKYNDANTIKSEREIVNTS